MFEELVRDGEKINCPNCQSTKLEKLLSVPARPQSALSDLPMACNRTGPPCGPRCGRFKDS
jgi:hypothetical protein